MSGGVSALEKSHPRRRNTGHVARIELSRNEREWSNVTTLAEVDRGQLWVMGASSPVSNRRTFQRISQSCECGHLSKNQQRFLKEPVFLKRARPTA